MAKSKKSKSIPDILGDALNLISEGCTYAEAAVRTGAPYWLISGSIRKFHVPVLLEEKDRIEEVAEEFKSTPAELIMNIVNYYWDDYCALTRKKG